MAFEPMGKRGKTGLTVTHGFCRNGTGGPEYRTLAGIKDRCFNPFSTSYPRYGARGISVCDRWVFGEGGLTGIECFVADLGRKPSRKHSIERIDNSGDYEPQNCRWATPTEQSNNTRRNKRIQIDGKEYTIAEASKAFGIPYMRLYKRIFQLGKSPEEAVKEPRYGF